MGFNGGKTLDHRIWIIDGAATNSIIFSCLRLVSLLTLTVLLFHNLVELVAKYYLFLDLQLKMEPEAGSLINTSEKNSELAEGFENKTN